MEYRPAGIYQPGFFTVSTHDLQYTERAGGVTTVVTGTAWVAGLAVYVPIVISTPFTVTEWWIRNGTLTTAHNLDYGLYNMDFTKIQSLGSTAGGTTASAINSTTTWTDLALGPGSYYMAFCDDSTRNFIATADAVGIYQASGIMEQTGLSSTLPSPMVPVTYTRAFLPFFGFNGLTTPVL